jgi:16S rRNA (guanine527-N7)-methyltransferase
MLDKYSLLPDAAMERLLEYGDLLGDAAERMGIVSRGDRGRLFMRHIRESIAPELVQALGQSVRVLDVGAGGGLPGIPLAIVRPDLQVMLLEPRDRKVAFLERVKLALGLANIQVRAGRIEELSGVATVTWDCAVSRALTWNRAMVRTLRGCIKEGGVLIRFGAAQGETPGGVKIVALEGSNERALQFWPPESWDSLPNTK